MRRLAGGVAGAALALLPAVVLALTSTPNDPFYREGYQWALSGNASSTNAPNAWCSTTGSGIRVADIDTGADFTHPDLKGRLIAGANFTSGNGDESHPDATTQQSVMDDYGHGTMTAGLITAATNNGYGIAGEAPGAQVLVVKVFSQKGGSSGYSAYESDVAAGVYWAVDYGHAQVINLSLGPLIPVSALTGDPIPAAVEYAASHGVAVSIAAGNGVADAGIFWPTPNYPQLEPYALVVGAMGPGGREASYSQSGNIYAPGGDGSGGDPHVDILSTFPTYGLPAGNQPMTANNGNGWASYDGTSFATPYGAGTLALLMAKGLSAAQARARILGTAKTVGGLPVLDAKAAAGACPAASSAGTTSTATRPAGVSSAPPAAATLPSAAPPSAAATPAPGAAPVTGGQAAANPVVARVDQVRRIPGAVAIILVVLGTACVAGAAIWFFRGRLFTQP